MKQSGDELMSLKQSNQIKTHSHSGGAALVDRSVAKVAVSSQLVSVVVVVGATLFYSGLEAAISFACGGLICTASNAYFAYRALRYSGARSAQRILGGFYSGEVGKIVLTAALMIAVLNGYPSVVLPFFLAGYVGTLLVGTFAPFIVSLRVNHRKTKT